MTDDRKKSLGEFLKSEREKRGLTIEQTSSATKIGLKILKQLEADKYSELPALPFVRGFVRNYGKFLGLDGEKLLQEYSSFLDEHSRERPKRDAGHSGYAFERPEGEQSRKVLWGVMAGMLVFGGAVVFLFKPALKRKHHAHVDKFKTEETPVAVPEGSPTPSPSGSPASIPVVSGVAPSPVPISSPSPVIHSTPSPFPIPAVPIVLLPSPVPSPIPSPVPSPIPSVVPVSTPTPTPAASVVAEDDIKKDPLQTGTNYLTKDIKYRIILRTKADVWVRYQCDDKQIMKFALKKDKILVLRGKSGLWFQTSNPDSITLKVGGGPEMFVSQSPERFDFRGNSTLVWPPQDAEIIDKKFKIGPPLPFTPSPPAENLTN